MGFSTSGAVAVVFVGLLLATGVLFPAVEGAAERLAEASDEEDDRALRISNSDVSIASASYQPGSDQLTVEVDNEGSISLDVEQTDLLVDGAYVVPDSTAVEGETDREVWAAGERLTLTVTGYTTDPDRVKVVAETGVADVETGV